MRKIGCLLALLAGGCAHQGPASSEESLAQAYESVASGGKAEARAAGYLIERAGDKGVRVVREAPIGGLGRDVTDAWITTKVKAKLAIDKDIKSRGVHVDTDAGLVTLRGTVDSRKQALEAVKNTLATDGVTAVSSELEYPEMRAKTNTRQPTRF
jgi:osmotically-inducible protein OsmY